MNIYFFTQHWTHRNFKVVKTSAGGSEGKMQWSLKVTFLRQTTEVPDIFNSGMLCVCGKGKASF